MSKIMFDQYDVSFIRKLFWGYGFIVGLFVGLMIGTHL